MEIQKQFLRRGKDFNRSGAELKPELIGLFELKNTLPGELASNVISHQDEFITTVFHFVVDGHGKVNNPPKIAGRYTSSDFWDGTIGDDQWFFYSAENNSINQMLQLFSEKFRKTIGFAQVYRHEEKILLIAENQNFESNYSLSELSDDFINLDFAKENSLSIGKIDNQYKLKLKINCEKALTKALSTFMVNNPPKIAGRYTCQIHSVFTPSTN